jgi:hypothetical protein
MDDSHALKLALDTARAFQSGKYSPLGGGGGADGPLSTFYAADNDAMKLPWLGHEVERWAPLLRDDKRKEVQVVEAKWREPVNAACDALISYAAL